MPGRWMLPLLAALALVGSTPALPPSVARSANLVTVSPSDTQLSVGDTLTVTVAVADPGDGCNHPIYDVTLSPPVDVPAVLRFDSPPRLGPPGPNPAVFHLTAIAPGQVILSATAFGESDCNGWNWEWRSGISPMISVGGPWIFFPLVRR